MTARYIVNPAGMEPTMPIEDEHPLNGPHPTDARI